MMLSPSRRTPPQPPQTLRGTLEALSLCLVRTLSLLSTGLATASLGAAQLSSSPLASAEAPLANKLEALRPYFTPPLGHSLTIDRDEEEGRKKRDRPLELKGFIRVSPPPGHCWTIQRREDLADDRVCSPTTLSFQLKDINGRGEIVWLVKTGPQDFGSPVVWPTPYRSGRYVDASMRWPAGGSQAFIVKGCTALHSVSMGRLLKIALFHNKEWTLRLPADDRLQLPLDRPKPRLYFQKKNLSSSPLSPNADSAAEVQAQAQAGAEGGKAKADLFAAAAEHEDWNVFKADWQSHPRDAYAVPADSLTVDAAAPAGSKGRCHYKYEGFEDDPRIGLLECHEAGPFRWILLPLTCIASLKLPAPP